jgi:hypothetical protein
MPSRSVFAVVAVRLPKQVRRTPLALVDVQVGSVVATFACARLRRSGLEVWPPLDAEGEPGIHASTAVRDTIKQAVVVAAEADPLAREHLARWRQRR